MNLNEAKELLLIYRPVTADAGDPQMAEALALAKSNPELARWLEAQQAQQAALRTKFRQMTIPAGLKEQIISEYGAGRRTPATLARWRTAGLALAALALLLGMLAIVWHPRSLPGNSLVHYQSEMARIALAPYSMDVETNNAASIHAYLAQQHAPDFTLRTPLQHTELTGCAVRVWNGAKVSLICFRTGKPLPPGEKSDLWLFVVDKATVQNVPPTTGPIVSKVNQLITATWTEGGKLYFLGVEGQEADIRQYL